MSQSFRSPPVAVSNSVGGGSSSIAVASSTSGPGSNGYNRRRRWLHRGAYSWTVPTGVTKIKIAGLGAGGGANRCPGAGGGLSIGEYPVTAGQVISITVGTGGLGTVFDIAANAGGTTTVACLAASINMVCNGGQGAASNTVSVRAGGTATGGNIVNAAGGSANSFLSNSVISGQGGSSSGTPWGDGKPGNDFKYGGLGWGTKTIPTADSFGGDSCHYETKSLSGANGLLVKGGLSNANAVGDFDGESAEFWDLDEADGGGGASPAGSAGNPQDGGRGGFGSGGGGGSSQGANGGFGGGGGGVKSGLSGARYAGNGGNGGGGGGLGSTTGGSIPGGNGGDGAVFIWY